MEGQERQNAIVSAYRQGASLSGIAAVHDISRQRVHQILCAATAPGRPEDLLNDSQPEEVFPREGTPISIREASRKYDVPADTVSRWVSHPDLDIRVLREPTRGGEAKLIDELDIYLVVREWRGKTQQGRREHIQKAAEALTRPTKIAASA